MLVLTDTFSGWPEAFPSRTNKAREVIEVLLNEIIPWFGAPREISPDRGPHFCAEIVQALSKALGIQGQLHTPYRSQASGQVENLKHMIQKQIAKIRQEINLYCCQALPIALIRLRRKPRSKEKVSSFEMLCGRPYGLNVTHDENLAQVGHQYVYEYLMATNNKLHQMFNTVFENQEKQPHHKLHAIDPGDWV